MMELDSFYMRRALQLATLGAGETSPNPMVGAIIVHNNRIIGEGYHHKVGSPHAEPNAINSVKNQALLEHSTLYVTLEPCSHWGRTPPCAQLIVDKGIKRVIIATLDPNPKVSGRGVAILKESGVEVSVGLMECEARWLNRRFITYHEKNRPYILLKWAQSSDGFIDKLRLEPTGGPVRISNSITKTLNHQVRVEEDAIMVATRTAFLDNPHLTVTKWYGKNPIRLLLDRNRSIPESYKIFDTAAKTVVFTDKLTGASSEYCQLDYSKSLPEQVLEALYNLNINSVIIEGGTRWLQTFIDNNLWDEARIEISPIKITDGIAAPTIKGEEIKYEKYLLNSITTLIPK